jgi:hypothetical protein
MAVPSLEVTLFIVPSLVAYDWVFSLVADQAGSAAHAPQGVGFKARGSDSTGAEQAGLDIE